MSLLMVLFGVLLACVIIAVGFSLFLAVRELRAQKERFRREEEDLIRMLQGMRRR